jgi:DNA-binding NarL/FixJ family response regulator
VRVLLLGAQDFVRAAIRTFLATDASIELCGDGALQSFVVGRLASLSPNVVVIDASTQSAECTATIRALRQLSRGLGIVALVASDAAADRHRAIAAGADECVSLLDVADRVFESIHRVAVAESAVTRLESLRQELNGPPRSRARVGTGALDVLDSELIQLLGEGTATHVIAARLRLPLRTIETRVAGLRDKLHLNSGVDLVAYCVARTGASLARTQVPD